MNMNYFKTTDKCKIAYTDIGKGTPLLCLSGLTRNSTDFDYILPYLTNMRVIRMDYRGRGKSNFDPNFKNYSIAREAQDVIELLDHLNIEKTAILGTSRGGIIAMSLGKNAKNRLIGVILNDIGPVLEAEGLNQIMDSLGRRPKFQTYKEAAKELPKIMQGFNNISSQRWENEAIIRWQEQPDGLHLRYDPKLRDAIEAGKHIGLPDIWTYFDALNGLPIALTRGENSNLLSLKTAKEMHRRRPDMIYKEVKDRGHIPFLDETECLDVIQQFLDKIRW